MKQLDKETQMSFKAKVAIFLLATLITLTGFNLIASSSALDMLRRSSPTCWPRRTCPSTRPEFKDQG
jgi:hypothetical protein